MLKKVRNCIIAIILVILLVDIIFWVCNGDSLITTYILANLLFGIIFYIYGIADGWWVAGVFILTALFSSIPVCLLQKHLPNDVKYLAKVWPIFCFMVGVAVFNDWKFWAVAFYPCIVPAILGIASVEANQWSRKKSEEAWEKLKTDD